MTRDTFDMFNTNAERGRFGENEQRDARSPHGTDTSGTVEIALFQHLDADKERAILVSRDGKRSNGTFWLPRSQITVTTTGPIQRKRAWYVTQPVTITMPMWLAKEKGLV